jgi:hypothetical protein
MDLALPSSVRRPAARDGVYNSAACGGGVTSSLRAGLLRGPARIPYWGGVLGAALQAASSNGGRGVHGLAGFFLGGVRPSEVLVVGAFGGGQERFRRWAVGPGGCRRCQMDVPLLVFGCRAWLASVIIVVGRWSPVALVGGRGASSGLSTAVFGGLVLAEWLLLFTPWCPVGRVILPLRISCCVTC